MLVDTVAARCAAGNLAASAGPPTIAARFPCRSYRSSASTNRPPTVNDASMLRASTVSALSSNAAECNSKRLSYEALVEQRKACHVCNGLTNPSAIRGGALDCDEIGAWSLWQGSLDAELMVVGQDWGDVGWFIRAEGRPTNTSTTNLTLIELLGSAGVKIDLPRDTPPRGPLFFTNAVLCMKGGDAQAPVKQEWFENCGTRFLRPLIDLLGPRVVVSLGKRAYEAVLTAYGIRPRKFRTAVESEEPDQLPGGASLFAVYHCGARVQNTHRPLADQLKDWKRIGRFLTCKGTTGPSP
jgi:uracil-DNA glycosylase